MQRDVKVAFFLAKKNLFSNKRMFFLINFIIGFSFLSANFPGLMTEGIQKVSENTGIDHATGHIVIFPEAGKSTIVDYEQIENRLRRVPNVQSVTSRLEIPVTFKDDKQNVVSSIMKFSKPENDLPTMKVNNYLIAGQYLSGSNEIVIGSELLTKYKTTGSERLDLDVGDIVDFTINGGKNVSVKISGVFSSYSLYYDRFSYADFKMYEKIFNKKVENVNKMHVKLEDISLLEETTRKIKNMNMDVKVLAWNDPDAGISDVSSSFEIIGNMITLIGLLVAIFVIYIIVYINILTKTPQIGIMRAVGITDKTIILSYIFLSVIYGLLGVALGTMLMTFAQEYFALNPLIMPLGRVSPKLNYPILLRNAIVLFISSLIAGYYPSKKITEKNILDSIFKG